MIIFSNATCPQTQNKVSGLDGVCNNVRVNSPVAVSIALALAICLPRGGHATFM